LFKAIKVILTHSIKLQGSSADNYIDAFGQPGKYVPKLKVYGREGEKCFRCGAKIISTRMASRGTAFCPKCQK